MATNYDDLTQRSQHGWRAFCVFLSVSTGAVIVALGLMAIFLL